MLVLFYFQALFLSFIDPPNPPTLREGYAYKKGGSSKAAPKKGWRDLTVNLREGFATSPTTIKQDSLAARPLAQLLEHPPID